MKLFVVFILSTKRRGHFTDVVSMIKPTGGRVSFNWLVIVPFEVLNEFDNLTHFSFHPDQFHFRLFIEFRMVCRIPCGLGCFRRTSILSAIVTSYLLQFNLCWTWSTKPLLYLGRRATYQAEPALCQVFVCTVLPDPCPGVRRADSPPDSCYDWRVYDLCQCWSYRVVSCLLRVSLLRVVRNRRGKLSCCQVALKWKTSPFFFVSFEGSPDDGLYVAFGIRGLWAVHGR